MQGNGGMQVASVHGVVCISRAELLACEGYGWALSWPTRMTCCHIA